MHFKRLRLSGFKSFVEPTELWIEPGLTGIVGPNGCGKSNLLEALRWVMGESSAKSMRGGGMEDVIFAGTTSRPARNLADVALLIDNGERRAPAAFNDMDELEVSRRIEREIGSAYRINGKDVRQKDVQLLFADAATGAHSPALVSQGRIGNLITAKPVQRRQLLEEAAGISGLHARRKEAEQRLKAAETNLERLSDVMVQMENQSGNLKRQARQAERYRAISGDIRVAEAKLLFSRWKMEADRLDAAEAALKRADAEVAEISGKAAKISASQAEIAARLPDLRKAEAEAAAALTRLKVAKESLDAEEARLSQTQKELTQRFTQAEQDLAREAETTGDAEAALKRLADERAALNEQMATAKTHFDDVSQKVKQAELAASEAEAAFDKINQEAAQAQARFETALGSLRAAERRLEKLQAEKARLENERARLVGQDDDSRALADAEARVKTCEENVENCRQIHDERQNHLTLCEAARDEKRKTYNAHEAESRQLKAEISALKSVLAAEENEDGAIPVSERIKVKRGYETAFGAALGDDLEAPLDMGRKYWATLPALQSPPALPEGVESLAQFVTAPEALARRLSQIGVTTAQDGARLAKDLRPGQRLVTKDGALWRWDGFTASAEAPSRASIRLAQRNRLSELEAKLTEAEKLEQGAHEAFQVARKALEETANALNQARKAENEANQALNDVRRTVARLTQLVNERKSKTSALDAAIDRISEDLKTAQREKEEAEATFAALPAIDGLKNQVEEARTRAAERRGDLSQARSTLERLQREREFAQDRLGAVEREEGAWRQRISRSAEQRQTLVERKEQIAQALQELADRPGEIIERRDALLTQITTAEAKRQEAADRLAKVENELGECDRLAKLVAEDLTQARERRVRIDTEMEAHGARKREIAHEIGQNFQCPPPLLLQNVGVEDEDNLPTLDVLEGKLERLKAERERLGAVNLRADIELQEMTEQLTHLRQEKSDLETAIYRLRAGIGSLNREGRERLLKAFEEVNGHFTELFTTLFGGGTAHLELVESDDPLEAGLEILASPPGKRLQYLSLLSGGEQALTALSLIFAVFMTNPAPICVLDEVDAPLDDANVDRFCNLLDEMTRLTQTRFLIVTHNAVTMSRMNRLFGVTMAERGVSQLVSVDLSQAEELRAAE